MLANQSKLPWWTWVLPIVVLHIGTQVSLEFKYTQGASDLYFPTALSLVMINWWGPARVLPAMYINAVVSTGLWGIKNYYLWPVFAVPETLFTLTTWLLFTKMNKGEYWIPNVKSLANFIIWAMFIPIMIEITALESLLVLFKEHSAENFWSYFIRDSLGEFTSSFGLALPLLYYITPIFQRDGLLIAPPDELIRKHTMYRYPAKLFELALIFVSLSALTFLIPFQRFWFVYGLFSMYCALRFGFGLATVTNYFIFLITYLIPKFAQEVKGWPDIGQENVVNIYLGMLLLYVFAAITGRVISDLKKVEIKLQRRNNELGQTNSELDRFVYSVSHDLSAPLKSIRGLVNVSRIDKQIPTESYLRKIEVSVQRLEMFISEILDYSRNKRIWQKPEEINIKELCIELIENLKFIEGFDKIKIDLDSLDNKKVVTDKSRLKIILNNLLSNAAKFHKKVGEEIPYIRVSSFPTAHRSLIIKVEDNGQGIRPELQNRIFEMFFRATDTEKGSGLGLYIAKEAAEKIGGRIWVHSEYGNGSVFQVEIPQNP